MDSQNDTPLGFWGSESEQVIERQYPLHRACRDGDVAALSRLVAEATREQMLCEDRFYGWTPIHWSAYFGKTGCLNGLLSTGMNVNLRTTRFQQTPAHVAAFGGHPLCLLELVKKGADFHAKDYLGETPLHKAARVGNIECIKTLVSNGAQVDISNSNGHLAGDLARMQNFQRCADALSQCLQQQQQQNGHNNSNNGNLQHTNGHQGNGHHNNGGIMNGASGCMTNGNGVTPHSNGVHSNGFHSNGVVKNGWSANFNSNSSSNGISRKRSFVDESIPQFKRARTTPCPPMVAPPMVAPSPPAQTAPPPPPAAFYANHEPMSKNRVPMKDLPQNDVINTSHPAGDDVISDACMDDCSAVVAPSMDEYTLRETYYASYLQDRMIPFFHGS